MAIMAGAGRQTIDQISNVVAMIERNPDSRRLIVSCVERGRVDKMACRLATACFSFMSPRAAVVPAVSALGGCFPRRAIQYRVLCAAYADGGPGDRLQPGDFIHTLGDAHLYLNHLEQARLQLSRAPRPLPTMRLNPAVKDIFAFRYEDFSIESYDPHPHIKAAVAV